MAPGTRLNDVYEIERLVAIGGMGEIYKGRTVEIGNPVAIKTIRGDLAENDDVLTLFRREASALHNLHHDAIVRYYVFSIDRRVGCPYLAMEFVEGPSLSDLLKHAPLTFEQTRTLVRRLGHGLQAAHDIGIFHRDISPDNIILPEGDIGRAKIIDFGIARFALGDGTIIGGGFAGKLMYVSPEQLGLAGAVVTARSDIYSFGLVLAHALLGRPLDMGGTQAQVLEKRKSVPDLSGIDGRLRPLVERMLQPDPDQRPGSMAELEAWCTDLAVAGSAWWLPQRLKIILGGLAGAALLVGGLGGALLLVPEAPTQYWRGSPPTPVAVDRRPDEQLAERTRLAEQQHQAADQEAQRRAEQERDRARTEEEHRLAAEAESRLGAQRKEVRVQERSQLAIEGEAYGDRSEQERARVEEQRRPSAEVEARRRAEQERLRIEEERRVAEEASRRKAERERREAEQRFAAEREGARRAEQEGIERVLAEEERRLAAEHEARRRDEQEHAQLDKTLQEEERRLAVEFEQRHRAERDGERLAQLRPGVPERPELPSLWRSLHEQLVRIGCAEAPIDGDRERVRVALERLARRVGHPAPVEITQSLVDDLRAQAPLPCGS